MPQTARPCASIGCFRGVHARHPRRTGLVPNVHDELLRVGVLVFRAHLFIGYLERRMELDVPCRQAHQGSCAGLWLAGGHDGIAVGPATRRGCKSLWRCLVSGAPCGAGYYRVWLALCGRQFAAMCGGRSGAGSSIVPAGCTARGVWPCTATSAASNALGRGAASAAGEVRCSRRQCRGPPLSLSRAPPLVVSCRGRWRWQRR